MVYAVAALLRGSVRAAPALRQLPGLCVVWLPPLALVLKGDCLLFLWEGPPCAVASMAWLAWLVAALGAVSAHPWDRGPEGGLTAPGFGTGAAGLASAVPHNAASCLFSGDGCVLGSAQPASRRAGSAWCLVPLRCCSVEEEAGIWLWLLRVKEHFRFLQLLAHSP